MQFIRANNPLGQSVAEKARGSSGVDASNPDMDSRVQECVLKLTSKTNISRNISR